MARLAPACFGCGCMRVRHLASLPAGLLAALAVAGFPAFATNQTIAAVGHSGWSPADVSIAPGESVTWTNGTGQFHNVCVRSAGAATGCGEYRSGNPSASWPSEGYPHPFPNAGTYSYICEQHPNMTGTITVGSGSGGGTGTGTGTETGTGTGTGTTTSPAPGSQPTDTTTTPTQTAPADTTAPSFVAKPKRRASRRSLILELRVSEEATLNATVFRRPPRGRSFTRVGATVLHVTQGKNVVTLPRKARGSLRSGAYKVKLQLLDAAGNRSPTTTLSFKLA